MNRNYAWRVRYSYWMRDGQCCESWNLGAREYSFTEKPYAERAFKTRANAERALLREGFSPVAPGYGQAARYVINHVPSKAPERPFSVFASVS